MTVFMTEMKQGEIALEKNPGRRRWPLSEKLRMMRESLESGKTVSLVARQHGVCAIYS